MEVRQAVLTAHDSANDHDVWWLWFEDFWHLDICWLRTGKLPGSKLSVKVWRVAEQDLEKFLKKLIQGQTR